MKLSSEFNVPAAPDKVAALFFDPVTMRDCLPGCEELDKVDDKTYRGVLTNEVAHVKFKAGFSAVIEAVEEPSNKTDPTVVRALLQGEDRRLGSTIKINATMTITPVGQESRVSYELEMAMWGKLGRLGESVIRRQSVEVERQFAEALAAVVTGKPIPHREKAGKKQVLRSAAPVGTTAPQPSPSSSEATGQLPAPQVAPALGALAVHRKQDLPFMVALTAAAFAWGVIMGNLRRGR